MHVPSAHISVHSEYFVHPSDLPFICTSGLLDKLIILEEGYYFSYQGDSSQVDGRANMTIRKLTKKSAFDPLVTPAEDTE